MALNPGGSAVRPKDGHARQRRRKDEGRIFAPVVSDPPKPETGNNGPVISDSAPDGPIFGRVREIDDFARLLRDRAQSSITLLGGDAGIGKTRLVREVATSGRQAGGVALVGRCLDLGDSAAPYLPITDIVRALRELPTADGTESIDRLVPADSPRPIEFFEAIAAMLDELAGRAPALVVFEDVHWADRSTRELLTYLFTHGVPAGVHLIATYRTDDRTGGTRCGRRWPSGPASPRCGELYWNHWTLSPRETSYVTCSRSLLTKLPARSSAAPAETPSSPKNSWPPRSRAANPTNRSCPRTLPTCCWCGPTR